jgi:hypothetical protein
MKKSKLRPLWIALICLAAAAAVGLAVYCGFLLVMARYVPEDPNISVEYAPDAKLTVTWQGSEKAQSYSLAAQGPQGTETMECESNSAVLTRPAYGGTLKVCIKARRFFGVGTAGKTVDIGTIADVDVKLSELTAPTPAFSVTDGKNLVLAWDDDGTHSYRVAELNGEGEYVPIVQTKGGTADIRLGRDLDMPRFGRPAQICVRREEAGEGYTLYGGYSAPVTVKKEDVVGTDITLDYSAGGERRLHPGVEHVQRQPLRFAALGSREPELGDPEGSQDRRGGRIYRARRALPRQREDIPRPGL